MTITITQGATGWKVDVPGRATTTWPTEWEALKFARFIAPRAGANTLKIVGNDGVSRVESLEQS